VTQLTGMERDSGRQKKERAEAQEWGGCCTITARIVISTSLKDDWSFLCVCGVRVHTCASTQAYSEKLVRLPTFFNCLQKSEMLHVTPSQAPPMVRNLMCNTRDTQIVTAKHMQRLHVCALSYDMPQ